MFLQNCGHRPHALSNKMKAHIFLQKGNSPSSLTWAQPSESSIYIYKTEAFEASTIFHVIIFFFLILFKYDL